MALNFTTLEMKPAEEEVENKHSNLNIAIFYYYRFLQ